MPDTITPVWIIPIGMAVGWLLCLCEKASRRKQAQRVKARAKSR